MSRKQHLAQGAGSSEFSRSDAGSGEFSRSNAGSYHARLRQKKHRGHVLRTVLIVLLLAVVGGGVAFAAWVYHIQSQLNDSAVVTDALKASLTERTAPQDPYYVLILGTDGRPGEDDYRADTIMLVRVDPANKHLTLLSIPRDTKVTYNGTVMKINAAHYYDGAAGMVDAVSQLCGVKISHYAEINFDGLSDITDAVGGVTVDVDEYMYDDVNFSDVVELQPGVQTLDGAHALFYTRCRKFANGDFTRMRHQRTFISALVKQILSSTDLVTLTNVVSTCAEYVTTDLSVTDAVSLAYEMSGIDVDTGVYSAYVPFKEYATIDGESYVVADDEKLAEMMKVIDSGGDPSTLNDGAYGSD
ncbi:MAG: LCP family protein [Olsenella sp.]|jgi:LCP family protein required for cell wall assembly